MIDTLLTYLTFRIKNTTQTFSFLLCCFSLLFASLLLNFWPSFFLLSPSILCFQSGQKICLLVRSLLSNRQCKVLEFLVFLFFFMLFKILRLILKELYFIFCLIKAFVLFKASVLNFVLKELDKPGNIIVATQRNGLDKLSHISFVVFVVLKQVLFFHRSEPVCFLELFDVLFGDLFEHVPKIIVS
jgi:hypothetical protein